MRWKLSPSRESEAVEIRIRIAPGSALAIECSEDRPHTAIEILEHAAREIRKQCVARENQQAVQPVSNGQLEALLKTRGGG